jgi:stearoyl-CoA desaturase (delta-9 desaturase)
VPEETSLSPYSRMVTQKADKDPNPPGEGYHNFHHWCPLDFRNGCKKWDWDPTKWVILLFHYFTNQIPIVKTASDDDIKRATERVMGRHLNVKKSSLPIIYESDITINFQGRPFIVLDGFLINVASFSQNHPGGSRVLETGYGGKDLSEEFRKLNHSGHARDLVERMRVAKVEKATETRSGN